MRRVSTHISGVCRSGNSCSSPSSRCPARVEPMLTPLLLAQPPPMSLLPVLYGVPPAALHRPAAAAVVPAADVVVPGSQSAANKLQKGVVRMQRIYDVCTIISITGQHQLAEGSADSMAGMVYIYACLLAQGNSPQHWHYQCFDPTAEQLQQCVCHRCAAVQAVEEAMCTD
jgi:hypothetical protein